MAKFCKRLCSGAAPGDAGAPQLFADLYQRLFSSGRESARTVIFRDQVQGEAVASIDRQSLIGQSWRETSRLVAVMAVALLGLCILVYAALADALRPTQVIRAGLDRLAAGDLSARLPPFDLAELSAVGNVFNPFAGGCSGDASAVSPAKRLTSASHNRSSLLSIAVIASRRLPLLAPLL